MKNLGYGILGVFIVVVFILHLDKCGGNVSSDAKHKLRELRDSIQKNRMFVDSLENVIKERDKRIEDSKARIDTIYKERIVLVRAKNIIKDHQIEHLGDTSTPSNCDSTILNNYASTILNLKEVESQNEMLDSSLTDCMSANDKLNQNDSLWQVKEDITNKQYKKAKRKYKWNGFKTGVVSTIAFITLGYLIIKS